MSFTERTGHLVGFVVLQLMNYEIVVPSSNVSELLKVFCDKFLTFHVSIH